jgi:hypothetical protein
MSKDTEELWDYLQESCGVSEQTLTVVTSINGWHLEALEDILYVVTGYRTLDQVRGMEDD